MFLAKVSHTQFSEYVKENDVAIIPIGATENHGTHLGLGTDHIIPDYLAKELEARLGVLVVPTVPYGVSCHHNAFDGTISIGYEGLYTVVKAITESLHRSGIRRFILLNGHGGNNPVLNRIGLELNQKGGRAAAAIINWWSLAGQLNPDWKGGHGGGEETAAMLFVEPDAVRMDLIEDFTPGNINELLPHSSISTVTFKGATIDLPRDVRAVTATGYFGPDHPSTATREWGEEMLKAVLDYTTEFVEAFSK